MPLRVYNTLTGNKEDFIPLDPQGKKVGMYVCGVTVYDDCHIGHARGALTFDIIRRYLKYKGYEVTYVRNITDIDDKIINRANERHVPWNEIAGKYTAEYYADMEKLGIQKADIEPKATEHIPGIIQMVQGLIANGYAYPLDGDVYFAVSKFPGYGKLSKRKLEDMQAGARVGVDERKRNPLDFALWKASKPGEPWWESPWSKGRPGWHIECSAMSMHFLGASLDIHGGGQDLIFPHHENEIAQSEGCTDKPFVKYWMHNGFVQVNQEKMSKSLGNFFTIKEILAKFPAETIRFFLLSTHYRSPIDFADERLSEAGRALERFFNTFRDVHRVTRGMEIPLSPTGERAGVRVDFEAAMDDDRRTGSISLRGLYTYRQWFEAAMDDDFNTAMALGLLFHLRSRLIDSNADPLVLQAGVNLIKELGGVLGLFEETKQKASQLPIPEQEIESLIAQRNQARAEKNWVAADVVRKKLLVLGIVLEDHPEGTSWKLKA